MIHSWSDLDDNTTCWYFVYSNSYSRHINERDCFARIFNSALLSRRVFSRASHSDKMVRHIASTTERPSSTY